MEDLHEAEGRIVHSVLRIGPSAAQVKDADSVDQDPLSLGRPGALVQLTVEDSDAVARVMVDGGGDQMFEDADREYGARARRTRDPSATSGSSGPL